MIVFRAESSMIAYVSGLKILEMPMPQLNNSTVNML